MSQTSVPCPHYRECGGCPLIELPYKEQLKIKEEKILTAFIEAGFQKKLIKGVLKKTRPSPLSLKYRNKAKWRLEKKADGKLRMGIYAPGTHDVVDIPQCSVHVEEINVISGYIKEQIEMNEVPVGNINADEAVLRYVIVRYSFFEKKLLAVFVTSGALVKNLDRVVRATQEKFNKELVALIQNINESEGDVLLGEANRYLVRKSELSEQMGSYRVPVGPLSFLQVNTSQAAYLYKRTKELIGDGPHDKGLDLYSGVGLFALHLSKSTGTILAVEEFGAAALESITACRRNKATNILQLCADAMEGVSTFFNEFGTPDWVTLNPPRKGCEEGVLKLIAGRPPRKIVYVSCGPKSLARDIAILTKEYSKFSIKTIEPVDMFPQTDHVECIVMLENKEYRSDTVKVLEDARPSKRRAQSKNKIVH